MKTPAIKNKKPINTESSTIAAPACGDIALYYVGKKGGGVKGVDGKERR